MDSEVTAHESGRAPSEGVLPAERHALSLLVSHRPRNVNWRQAAGLLFGDWGTSRLYVLGLAFFFAPRTSLWLLAAMSVLLLAVGWAYTQICRVYPDGGGVYTAAKRVSRTLAVIGALLLFADYVVTASLSALDAFHYFFGDRASHEFWSMTSPGLWAVIAVLLMGLLNFLGPRHTGGFAIMAAAGMIFITLLISAFALPRVDWASLPSRIGPIQDSPQTLWLHFVAIVLALSGVEAIGNLAGVMKKPVARTSRRAIWVVAGEVALFNLILGVAMVSALPASANTAHKEDMLAFLGAHYVGPWAEVCVRLLGGVLLLSAVNTVITGMISLQYLLSRDGELPAPLQKLNRFGVPWLAAITAMVVPCVVLLLSHELESLAALYAIGVVGAVAINISLVALHPRVRHWWRKGAAVLLAVILTAIWITLAVTKLHALIFVGIVLTVGLTARYITRRMSGPVLSPANLLRQAILEQITPEALTGRKVLLATAGSARMAEPALAYAKLQGASLVVAFVREVTLGPDASTDPMTLDQDHAAQSMFTEFLAAGHRHGVTIIPMYDVGSDPVEQLAEAAAMEGVDEILLGSSRRSVLHRLIKGRLQTRLEAILPREIGVRVLDQPGVTPEGAAAASSAEPNNSRA